jgi:chromosome segregation protein
LAGIEADIGKGAVDRERYERETRTAETQLRQWTEEKASREAGLAQVRERVAEIDREGRAFQERVTEARLLSEGQRAKREHEQANQVRVKQQQAEVEQRRQSLTGHLEGLRLAIQESREEQTRQEAACQELGAAAMRLKAELVATQERQTQELAVCQALETNVDELRRVMSAVRDARMAIEVRRAELRTQLGTVESTLVGTYQLDLSAMTGEGLPLIEGQVQEQAEVAVNPLTHTPSEELKAQLQKLRERLDRMGPINLAAIGEHQELEQRYTFLSTQEQDLSNSMASLKEIIQRINRTTKDMFAATFIELQEKFGEVFGKFFPGGRAELQLVEEPPTDNGDGTGHHESGIDIVAQPPGKRLKSITMLSGGEKTLTAMALLFASFLIRPTPFCLLDEIDAPLDEENIGRFTDVLRDLAQNAQFLVITHNKRTMGIADSLFGVTMEEPGVSKLVSVRLGDLQPA